MSSLLGCVRPVSLASQCPSLDPLCEDGDDAVVDAGMHTAIDANLCSASLDGACACDAPVRGQVLAHWSLDEVMGNIAGDVSSHESDGTLQGFVGTPWGAGKLAGALSFDGVDDRVQIGAVRGEVRSLALWLKPASEPLVRMSTPMQLPTSHGPLDQWTDPENGYLDDGKLATASSVFGQKLQHWGGFNLGQLLPPSANIRGITVAVDTGNLGVLGAFTVELSSDDGLTHTDQRRTWGQLIAGSNLRQAGGADVLWGRSWAVDDFSDERFRVWASFGGIANAMGLDFLSVEVHYTLPPPERTVLTLNATSSLALGGADGKSLVTSGWPGSSVIVNGVAGGTLGDDWNYVVVTSSTGVPASDVQLGAGTRSPYHGLMDDVILLDSVGSDAGTSLCAAY